MIGKHISTLEDAGLIQVLLSTPDCPFRYDREVKASRMRLATGATRTIRIETITIEPTNIKATEFEEWFSSALVFHQNNWYIWLGRGDHSEVFSTEDLPVQPFGEIVSGFSNKIVEHLKRQGMNFDN